MQIYLNREYLRLLEVIIRRIKELKNYKVKGVFKDNQLYYK